MKVCYDRVASQAFDGAWDASEAKFQSGLHLCDAVSVSLAHRCGHNTRHSNSPGS